MAYTTEVAHSWEGDTASAPHGWRSGTSYKYYRYWLELDENDSIIGGSWVSEGRPDFLWTQKVPEFYGYFERLKELYELSIAEKPEVVKPAADEPAAPSETDVASEETM